MNFHSPNRRPEYRPPTCKVCGRTEDWCDCEPCEFCGALLDEDDRCTECDPF